ncbi:ABC-type transporter Mla subunit MlaD [Arthrobacter sp. CAN_A214]
MPDFTIIVVFVLFWAVVVLAAYWLIRLGVKHGLRSYYAEVNSRPDPTE